MKYDGRTWPTGKQSGGPAITITPPNPMRDRHERLLAYEGWKLDQAPTTIVLAATGPTGGGS